MKILIKCLFITIGLLQLTYFLSNLKIRSEIIAVNDIRNEQNIWNIFINCFEYKIMNRIELNWPWEEEINYWNTFLILFSCCSLSAIISMSCDVYEYFKWTFMIFALLWTSIFENYLELSFRNIIDIIERTYEYIDYDHKIMKFLIIFIFKMIIVKSCWHLLG